MVSSESQRVPHPLLAPVFQVVVDLADHHVERGLVVQCAPPLATVVVDHLYATVDEAADNLQAPEAVLRRNAVLEDLHDGARSRVGLVGDAGPDKCGVVAFDDVVRNAEVAHGDQMLSDRGGNTRTVSPKIVCSSPLDILALVTVGHSPMMHRHMATGTCAHAHILLLVAAF